jgi:hypothetical protein
MGIFVGLILVPISIYFYAFHGDWALLYVVDSRPHSVGVRAVMFSHRGVDWVWEDFSSAPLGAHAT